MIILCIALIMGGKPQSDFYPLAATIVEIDAENDIVYCVDTNGFEWSFYDIDDWQINDCCVMVMNDKGTEIIFDDEIVSVRYLREDFLKINIDN